MIVDELVRLSILQKDFYAHRSPLEKHKKSYSNLTAINERQSIIGAANPTSTMKTLITLRCIKATLPSVKSANAVTKSPLLPAPLCGD